MISLDQKRNIDNVTSLRAPSIGKTSILKTFSKCSSKISQEVKEEILKMFYWGVSLVVHIGEEAEHIDKVVIHWADYLVMEVELPCFRGHLVQHLYIKQALVEMESGKEDNSKHSNSKKKLSNNLLDKEGKNKDIIT